MLIIQNLPQEPCIQWFLKTNQKITITTLLSSAQASRGLMLHSKTSIIGHIPYLTDQTTFIKGNITNCWQSHTDRTSRFNLHYTRKSRGNWRNLGFISISWYQIGFGSTYIWFPMATMDELQIDRGWRINSHIS